MVIQLEVSRLPRIAAPEVQVRLVPDLEVPLRYFSYAIAIDEMPRKLADQIIPLGIILGWRDVLLIPESMQRVLIGSQRLGHETQLNERTNTISQQAVINLIDIRK